MKTQSTILGKTLVFTGALLVLIGVIQGALIPYFTNPRMGLSAHLDAVQSGMLLMIFGVIWPRLVLKNIWDKIAYYSINAGMYLIWFGITLAAVLGASKALPIAGSGFEASYVEELLVQFILIVGSVLGLLGTGVIVFGLYKGLQIKT